MLDPLTDVDVDRMKEQLFFEGGQRAKKLSRFWLLLILSAVIASAGVVGDSTATVIGAMIVAPLMTPILGIALATMLTDRSNLARCAALVVGGAITVVGIAYVVGLCVDVPIVAATNSQVAARVSPGLIDLVAAVATGAVGAVALSRADISDTLPGVAIAISLVPPLAVVGLTLESGQRSEAAGALLLFVANVTAILGTGMVVLALYGVHRRARPEARSTRTRVRSIVVVALMMIVVAAPLADSTVRATRATLQDASINSVCSKWAAHYGWSVESLSTDDDVSTVRFTGPTPAPNTNGLRRELRQAGLSAVVIHAQLVPGSFVSLTPR